MFRAHEKCADVAPRDCGLRPRRTPAVHHQHYQFASPLHGITGPLSKLKKESSSSSNAIAALSDGGGKERPEKIGSPKRKSIGVVGNGGGARR